MVPLDKAFTKPTHPISMLRESRKQRRAPIKPPKELCVCPTLDMKSAVTCRPFLSRI